MTAAINFHTAEQIAAWAADFLAMTNLAKRAAGWMIDLQCARGIRLPVDHPDQVGREFVIEEIDSQTVYMVRHHPETRPDTLCVPVSWLWDSTEYDEALLVAKEEQRIEKRDRDEYARLYAKYRGEKPR
jgi:hypothetical protein